jgi:hypothetical protein
MQKMKSVLQFVLSSYDCPRLKLFCDLGGRSLGLPPAQAVLWIWFGEGWRLDAVLLEKAVERFFAVMPVQALS